MLNKLGQALIVLKLRIKNTSNRLWHEEKGGTEIVAILLIIIILVALAVIFKDKLLTLINDLFEKISTDVKTEL